MKLILAMVLFSGAAYAADEPAGSVVIPPDVVKACEEAGGCVLVPKPVLLQQLQKAYEAGAAEEYEKQKNCARTRT